MDVIGLLLGLSLVWAFGIACLAALPRRTAHADEPGGIAWMIGASGLAGLFLATLWLRALSLAGIHFSAAAIALPLLAATLALGGWAVRRGRRALRASFASSVRDSFSQMAADLSGRSLDGTARTLWRLLLAWLALRAAMLFAEVTTHPLYPWDAWMQWATKARVWYEMKHIVPFLTSLLGELQQGAFYTDAAQLSVDDALWQVFSHRVLGAWDDVLMNLLFGDARSRFSLYGAGSMDSRRWWRWRAWRDRRCRCRRARRTRRLRGLADGVYFMLAVWPAGRALGNPRSRRLGVGATVRHRLPD